MLCVVATLKIDPEHTDQVLKALQQVTPTVQDEPGCITYHPCVDSAQGLTADVLPRPNTITVFETWASEGALHRHLETAHMQEFHRQVEGVIVERDVRLLDPQA
ncbi:putative quinol monooxygenase [Halomonas huangheensis]|uniref:ABM domain-containing protein n=1 Tax=Halomonas huangheensis TaxID=1178482 RepID=W1N4V0_9GAMM|nr:putative quinol monooxygenase [Halomonas huangheensis]ALM51988.1 hypothetical protein AR456_06610 [Halomonas huangheensis]ERL50529.1 hypothetical protein BJB45_05220 [Halomonas huangheensis]